MKRWPVSIDANGRSLPPDHVFEALHANPLLLLHAEMEMKRLQLAEAPQHGLLFVNLDPDSYAVGEAEDGENVFLPVLRQQRSRLVVEVIENLHLQDVESFRAHDAPAGQGENSPGNRRSGFVARAGFLCCADACRFS